MLGRSHALSGAVGWIGGCALFAQAGHQPSWTTVVVGGLVSAGFALLPDLDHPGSTVARTLGPVTKALAWVVAFSAAAARKSSCGHCAGDQDRGGHRAATHTTLGALVAGLTVSACAWKFGPNVALGIIGFAVWLAVHTALSAKTRALIGDMILPGEFRRRGRLAYRLTAGTGALIVAAAAVGLAGTQAGAIDWWWIGIPVAWGCLAHSLGDSMTISGSPLLWPIEIRGCRWQSVGTPRWMRFRTGSRVETCVVVLMAAVGFAATYALAA